MPKPPKFRVGQVVRGFDLLDWTAILITVAGILVACWWHR